MKKKRFRRGAALLLALVITGCSVTVPAEDEYYDYDYYEEVEPTQDPHMPAYYEPAQTDSLAKWPAAPAIEGKAAVVIDLMGGGILYAKNADTQLYPASITKIMTCLLACENLPMDTPFVMSESAAYGIESGSSSIYADTGEEFTMEQALMALMLESANEIALRLAEMISGNPKKFAELMNQRARELGCTNTHFNNPHGLPDINHYTSAMDMALIARAAWNNKQFRRFCCTDYYNIPPTNIQPETRYMRNHHQMMEGMDRAFTGVFGGKTGYTTAAGNTLVTYARRGNMRLGVVVLKSLDGAYTDTANLLNYGFDNFAKLNVSKATAEHALWPNALPCEKYTLKNMGNVYPLYFRSRVYAIVPRTVEISEVICTHTRRRNALGSGIIDMDFRYQDNLVAKATAYARPVLKDLLIDPSYNRKA